MQTNSWLIAKLAIPIILNASISIHTPLARAGTAHPRRICLSTTQLIVAEIATRPGVTILLNKPNDGLIVIRFSGANRPRPLYVQLILTPLDIDANEYTVTGYSRYLNGVGAAESNDREMLEIINSLAIRSPPKCIT